MSTAKKYEDFYSDEYEQPLESEKESLRLLVNTLKEQIESSPENQKKMANILTNIIKDS